MVVPLYALIHKGLFLVRSKYFVPFLVPNCAAKKVVHLFLRYCTSAGHIMSARGNSNWLTIILITSSLRPYLYIVIQNIESYVITPSIMHKQVKLLPGLTLTAQFIFTILFGPLGLLLAIPMAVVIQVFVKEIIIHDLLEKNYFSTKL